MKFTIKTNVLLEQVNNIIKGVSTKNIIPILGGIKIDVTHEGIFLTSSDDDIAIQSFIEKGKIENIEKTGSIVVIGKYFHEIIRKIPNQILDFELIENGKLYISNDTIEFTLNGMDSQEYPNINFEFNKIPLTIDAVKLKEIINQTGFAISTQESRPILTGININIDNKLMECIATDSYRLAQKNILLDTEFSDSVNIVVPGKNLFELQKIIGDSAKTIELHIFSNKILFKFDNILFQSRILSGNYPDVSKLIPDEENIKIVLDTNLFYNVIDRASLLTSEKDKNTVIMEISNGEMKISSSNPEIGTVEEKITLEDLNVENFKIAFSSKYMMEALRALTDKKIRLYLNGEIKPIIIKNESDDNLIQLILPIKTF